MNRKRILRSWWLWAAVIVFAFLILPNLLSSSSSFHGVSTSDALGQVKAGNVTQAVVKDKEQTLQLTLKTPFVGKNGKYTKISTQYPADAAITVVDDLDNAKSPDGKGPLQWRTAVTK